jgi:hypothetical protein
MIFGKYYNMFASATSQVISNIAGLLENSLQVTINIESRVLPKKITPVTIHLKILIAPQEFSDRP